MTKPIPKDEHYQRKVRRREAKHAADLEAARVFAQAHSLPVLVGTPLQVLWAERLRHQQLAEHPEWIGTARDRAEAADATFWIKSFWVPGWIESQLQ